MNFIQQAYKGENEFWKWLVTILVVMSSFILNFMIYFFIPFAYDEMINDTEDFVGDKNLFLVENLIPFALLLILLFVFVKFLHQRSIKSLITSRSKVDWKRFFYGFFSWGIISVFFLSLGYFLAPEDYVWNFKAGPFFFLLTISLLLFASRV